jgi:hypothetical protein
MVSEFVLADANPSNFSPFPRTCCPLTSDHRTLTRASTIAVTRRSISADRGSGKGSDMKSKQTYLWVSWRVMTLWLVAVGGRVVTWSAPSVCPRPAHRQSDGGLVIYWSVFPAVSGTGLLYNWPTYRTIYRIISAFGQTWSDPIRKL